MLKREDLPQDFLDFLAQIENKRARIVIEHILNHGYVTTEELDQIYGYKHPPRAARDVREQGVPLETFRVVNSDRRSIAAYRLGDIFNAKRAKLGGRKLFSKKLKTQLMTQNGAKCAICETTYENRYLQIDHRIPYEVSGDSTPKDHNLTDYMLLCSSCNRAKSWSCEHCENYVIQNPQTCLNCYWANPHAYTHIALQPIRRLDITWTDSDVETFEKLSQEALNSNLSLQSYIKLLIAKHFRP